MAYKGSLFQVLKDDGTVQGEIVFDAIVSEEHEIENKVTEFPIDSGFVVSDHVIRKNRVLKMQVVSVRHAFEGRRRKSITSDSHNKIQADFDLLTEMVQEGRRCNVVTILGAYSNCIVTKFRTKQDVETTTILQANLILKEMNVVGVDPSASKQALVDTANSVTDISADDALKKLLGDDYGLLEGSNSFGGF